MRICVWFLSLLYISEECRRVVGADSLWSIQDGEETSSDFCRTFHVLRPFAGWWKSAVRAVCAYMSEHTLEVDLL